MAFKYINPGLVSLFDKVPADVEQRTDKSLTYSRTSGDYFYCTGNPGPVLFIEKSKEYWVSFYWYPRKNNASANAVSWMFGLYAAATDADTNVNSGIYIKRTSASSTSVIKLSFHNGKNTLQYGNTVNFGFALGKGYHMEIYAKDDATDGKIILWVNGQQVYEYAGLLRDGSGFERLYFSGAIYSLDYFSDIVVQNTGRIGDLRVNALPIKTTNTICEWESVMIPVGSVPEASGDSVGSYRTMILINHPLQYAGKIHAIYFAVESVNTTISFFLIRKNTATGKYNSVNKTKCIAPKEATNKFELPTPLQVESGDLIAMYLNEGYIHCTSLSNANYIRMSTTDLSQSTEFDMPTSTYSYMPCLCTLFEPDDTAIGKTMLLEMQANDPALAVYGQLTTEQADKIMAGVPEIGSTKIGRIESVAAVVSAYRDGEVATAGLSCIISMGDTTYETATKVLSTAEEMQCFDVLDKNPVTGSAWSVADLSTVNIGVKSKA